MSGSVSRYGARMVRHNSSGYSCALFVLRELIRVMCRCLVSRSPSHLLRLAVSKRGWGAEHAECSLYGCIPTTCRRDSGMRAFCDSTCDIVDLVARIVRFLSKPIVALCCQTKTWSERTPEGVRTSVHIGSCPDIPPCRRTQGRARARWNTARTRGTSPASP